MKKRKLSAGQSRADLIASYGYGAAPAASQNVPGQAGRRFSSRDYPDGCKCSGCGSLFSEGDAMHAFIAGEASMPLCATCALAGVVPDVPKLDVPKPEADPDAADAAVTDAIAAIKADIDKAIDAQGKDPDLTDPKDEKVLAGLKQIQEAVAQLVKDQADDAAAAPAPVAAAGVPAAGAPPVSVPGGKAPNANPVSDDGSIDNGAVCTTPDCGHLASSHANTEDGENTGACAMNGCECPGMNVDTDPTADDSTEDDDEDDTGLGGGAPGKSPQFAVADAPAPPVPAASGDAPDLNAPPPVAGSENMGPAFTIPVLIIEGQPTGDGRQIAVGALDWRKPPIPLMGLATETHDPEGFDMNDPSVICGRIDSLSRVDGEGGTQIIMAHGFYLPNADGLYFSGLTEAFGRCGISADVALHESEIEITEVDQMGFPLDGTETLTKGTIMGATQVPFPAFEGAYVVLGDGTAKPEVTPIPQTADSPVVPDKPPASVTAGGQLLHLMAHEACEPCQTGVEVITAAGGPVAPPSAWFADPEFKLGDGRLVEILDRRGKRGDKYACPITVTPDGRVFGHIAPWGICHTGHAGQCILAPRSGANYAHFKRGQQITTAEGEQIRVGVITADTGHASIRPGVSASAAMAHYDNTALAVADVNIGEDDYGIWVAGALRPGVTEAQVRKLTASSISGDWRNIGGQLELVAALAVNQPGFPLAVVADGRHEALVAAGATVMDRMKHPAEHEPADPTQTMLAALSGLLPTAARSARDRIAAHR